VKQPVTLDIAGARYRMTSDADPEHLRRLAAVINDRIAELGAKAVRSAPTAQLLAVVALGLAEDLEVAEARRLGLESKTRRVLGDAIARIDRRLSVSAAETVEPSSESTSEPTDP
jgi:cell division protein ZapA (FtsZ GTPase activity inhibitor)